MTSLARIAALPGLVLLVALLISAGCEDEPAVTSCPYACVDERGALYNCPEEYRFDELTEQLAERPDLQEFLGFSEVTTCEQASFLTHVLRAEE